jgi:tetratricopeptide (TPR) repeat protein
VGALVERSLATPAADGRLLVHRLVRHVVRTLCHRAGTLDAVVTAAAEALYDAGLAVGTSWTTRTLIGEYAAHAATLTTFPVNGYTRRRLVDVRLWMQEWLANVNDRGGAATLGPSLLRDCERILGADAPTTSTARRTLADAYSEIGRFDEAVALYLRNLAVQERLFGPDHPDTITARDDLALAHHRVGRLEEAIPLYERVLSDRYRVQGLDHPDTLASRLVLALVYDLTGRKDEAIALYEHTVADSLRVFGPDHPQTTLSRMGLAKALEGRGNGP